MSIFVGKWVILSENKSFCRKMSNFVVILSNLIGLGKQNKFRVGFWKVKKIIANNSSWFAKTLSINCSFLLAIGWASLLAKVYGYKLRGWSCSLLTPPTILFRIINSYEQSKQIRPNGTRTIFSEYFVNCVVSFRTNFKLNLPLFSG